jgi:hypothetical protein
MGADDDVALELALDLRENIGAAASGNGLFEWIEPGIA